MTRAREVTTLVLLVLFWAVASSSAWSPGQGHQARQRPAQGDKRSGKDDGKGDERKATPRPADRQAGEEKRHAPEPPPRAGYGHENERALRPYDRPVPPGHRTSAEVRAWQQRRGWQEHGGWGPHNSWKDHRARQWHAEHFTWAQRGGYRGYYIPDVRFRVMFGPTHWFRIPARPVIVEGYPRFHYGGFWFMLVDPWPEYWVETWYASDDVYIDYDDGYYLHNRRHPGVRLAITVVM